MTAYLEFLILEHYGNKVTAGAVNGSRPSIAIITPSDPEQRGCQLSISLSIPVRPVFEELSKRGAVVSFD